MKAIILYGSRYGSARRYAEELSEQTGIPTADYKNAPPLSDKNVIVYLGGLYAGGLPGLVKTFRGVSLRKLKRLIIVTGKQKEHSSFAAKTAPKRSIG